MKPVERCDGCKFWLATDEDESAPLDEKSGFCRRYPRVLDLNNAAQLAEQGAASYDDYRYWNNPVTEGAAWCGEFRKSSRLA